MKQRIRKIITISLIPVSIWLLCIVKCEINTILYGWEFEGEHQQTQMIGGNPKPKVLKYSKNEAEIYFVDEMGGDIIIYEKINEEWVMKEWVETVWSKGGSAEGIMWPYIR